MVLSVIVLLLLLLLVYAWVGFPLILYLLTRGHSAAPTPEPGEPPDSVAVLLAAYNEEAHIGERIRNLLEQDVPAGRFEIHVGADGCSDRTVDVAREIAAGHPHVHVHAFDHRRGKVAVLKDLVSRVDARFLVFTDANAFFRRGAVRTLLAHFSDSTIGGVCGRLVLAPSGEAHHENGRTETGHDTEEGFYWRWETILKEQESALDSCLGANGAIFAMRRELFWQEMPDNTMVDDLVIGMKVREQGYRVLYEPHAVAMEELPDVADEWGRRVRIGAGDYQALLFCRRCLGAGYGRFAWIFWSHKVLRWFTPHAALLVALAIWPLFCHGLSLATALASVSLFLVLLFLILGGIGWPLRASRSPLARIPLLFFHFDSMQAALFVGFLKFITGNLSGHWHRTPRAAVRSAEREG